MALAIGTELPGDLGGSGLCFGLLSNARWCVGVWGRWELELRPCAGGWTPKPSVSCQREFEFSPNFELDETVELSLPWRFIEDSHKLVGVQSLTLFTAKLKIGWFKKMSSSFRIIIKYQWRNSNMIPFPCSPERRLTPTNAQPDF